MTSQASPRLSVVIPAHNGERYLEECAASVLGQDFTDLELILVDDASSDATRDVIGRLAAADPRVRPVLLDENQGTLGARQAGVAASRGAYVTLVDQDDELAPGALAKVMAHAGEADIVHFGVCVEPEGEAAQSAAAGMVTVGGERTREGRVLGIDYDLFRRGKESSRDTVVIKGADPEFKMVSRIVVRKDGMIAVNKDIAISLKYSSILSKLDLIDYGIIRLFPSQDRFQ